LDGLGTPDEYATRWKNYGDYLCVTDHGMMAAIPSQIRACEASGKKDDPNKNKKLNSLYGCEIYVNPLQIEYDTNEELQKYIKTLDPEQLKIMRHRGYHLLAIAYNNTGYSNLVRLSSLAWTKGFYYRPRVNHEQLMKYKEGIFFTSCCYASEIGQAFDKGGEEAGFAMIEKYMAMFGNNFFLEIILLDFVKQKPYDVFILKAHEKYKLPLVITQDCLVENTMILTEKGNIPIQNVCVDDMVLTHAGNFKRVEYVNTRSLNKGEDVYRIKAALGSFAWEATGNHLVRVCQIGHKKGQQRKEIKSFAWKRIDELTMRDYLVIPKIKKKDIFSNSDLPYIDLFDYILSEDYALEKNKRNKLRFDETEDVFISCHGFDARSTIKIPRKLALTEDFLRIIGLYIAEGGLDTNSNLVTFGLHRKEQDELDLIKRFFYRFGITIGVRYVGEGMQARFQSVIFRKLFSKVCGEGSLNKKLPQIHGTFFRKFSQKQVLTILMQYFRGDGHWAPIHERPMNVGSVSKSLIYDIAVVLNSLGFPIIPSVRKSTEEIYHKNPNANPANWNDWYYIGAGSNTKVRLHNLLEGTKDEEKPNRHSLGRRYVEGDDCYAVRIRKIEKIKYDKLVYNLQVEEDESYVANLHQVHNCHYPEAGDSKYQQYMLMAQTTNTIGTIKKKMEEEGMQDFFELQDTNLWMKTEEELNDKWLKDYSDVIDYDLFKQAKMNTVEICRRAKGVELDRSIKLPQIPDADEKLKEYMIEGFKRRNLPKTRVYLDRLKEEYSLVCHKGFSSYFLIDKMMTDEARRIGREMFGGDGSEAVGPGRGCLTPDSNIVLFNGKCKAIKDMVPGDFVVTRDGSPGLVEVVYKYPCDEEMVRIYCYYGDSVGLTKDHLVLAEKYKYSDPTGDLRWIPAGELEIGDWVFIPGKISGSILQKIIKIEPTRSEIVYDLQVKGNHNYLTTSFLVHNSAAGSLIFYCLGVTDVDPVHHDLLFSRFLSPARGGKSLKLRFSTEPLST
jgi:intein/homing endonuclease